MGKNIIPEIRDNYSFYTQLLKERKYTFNDVIEISKVKDNKKNFLINSTVLTHEIITDEIFLISEVKIDNYKCFQFKLRCISLSQTPFFRFDSDGGTHRNYDENIPLKDQQIKTPHFNCFNEIGLSIAYQTEQLKNEQERKALEDINFCIAHFCNESNLRLKKNDNFPSISILPGTFQMNIIKDDPNSNIQFT